MYSAREINAHNIHKYDCVTSKFKRSVYERRLQEQFTRISNRTYHRP